MAHFYASIENGRGKAATKTGTSNGGITGHVRGWGLGIKVEGEIIDGKDTFKVYVTGGSNNPSGNLIATVSPVTETNGQTAKVELSDFLRDTL